MFVKGLDNRGLTTNGTEVSMDQDNRAFVKDYPYDNDTYWAYQHDLIGGSVKFTVDVSNIPCGCAAGIFAVGLDNAGCSWNAKANDEIPACATVDIMTANTLGFNVQSLPCVNGICDTVSQCKRNAKAVDTLGYGPGATYKIDTTKPY